MSRMRYVLVAVIGCLAAGHAALSQVTIPAFQTEATHRAMRPLSAAEAASLVMAEQAKLNAAISVRQANYPGDSMRNVMVETSARWLARIESSPVQGIQHDAAGRIAAAARQETDAVRHFDARLATPGLSFGDRAFTYLTAVQTFADAASPEQLLRAEAYLRSLDAMGDSAASWQFQARMALVHAYYALGRGSDIIRLGVRAIQLMPVMPYYDRGLMFPYTGGDGELYAVTVDALTHLPQGRAQIKELNGILRAAIVPPPAMVALDPAFVERGETYRTLLDKFIAAGALLGMPGAPIVANYWLNRATRDSAVVPVNDGKIRVIEEGSYTCASCLVALQGVQRLQQQFPNIQAMMMTWTSGFWGNREMEPDEAPQLTEYYLNQAKVTIPIAIWRGPKVLAEDGGMVPEGAGPNFQHYPMVAKPTIWILDGTGTIRRVFLGYSREQEAQIVKVIQYLEREQSASSPR